MVVPAGYLLHARMFPACYMPWCPSVWKGSRPLLLNLKLLMKSLALPITSYLCQWKAPMKRKESELKMSDVSFEKHVYGQVRKYQLKSLESSDPPNCIGKMKDRLPTLLEKVRGKPLCTSYLFDPSTCYWDTHKQLDSYNLCTVSQLQEKVETSMAH